MNDKTYSISELAREFGLTLRAVRFYETRGLIAPHRSGSVRIYSEPDREKLCVIVQRRAQGFTLSEIKASLEGAGIGRAKIHEQIIHLRHQRDEIDRALADLEKQVAELPS